MIPYPDINPVIFRITDALQIRWYGLMYLIGFSLAWLIMRLRTKNIPGWENTERLNDLIFYAATGAILGGRIGYCLFYNLHFLLTHPLNIFKIWEGGMSFHGGLIGVILGTWLFVRHYRLSYWEVADIMAPAVPLGLGLGRLGNFINGELWGKITTVPWGMVFPTADLYPRHPSPLYGVLGEGILLFIIVWWYARIPRPVGSVAGVFFLGYGIIRIIEEFFRMPDPQYGYLAFGWLTMGQLLCIPMVIAGIYLIMRNKKHPSLCVPT
jgi:phosphatidylglycerol:prolipoprotein diacylglycerol transferase